MGKREKKPRASAPGSCRPAGSGDPVLWLSSWPLDSPLFAGMNGDWFNGGANLNSSRTSLTASQDLSAVVPAKRTYSASSTRYGERRAGTHIAERCLWVPARRHASRGLAGTTAERSCDAVRLEPVR